MIKTGSKFLYGLAAFGFVVAFAYALATNGDVTPMDALLGPLSGGYKGAVGDHLGYSILIGLSAVALFLAIFLSSLRDTDPEVSAKAVGLETVPEVPAPVSANYWPVVGAFSAGALVLGLAIGPILFVMGMIGLSIVLLEWAVRAWSDRATGDPEVNKGIRDRLMYPIEIPGLAVIGIAGLVLAVSRILLALPKVGGYLVFALVSAAILGVGALIVSKPKLSQSVIAGMLLFGGVAILAGGVAAAIVGEREHESHDEEHSDEEGDHGEGEEGLAPVGPGQMLIRVGN